MLLVGMALTDAGYCELNCRELHAAAVAILTNDEQTSRLIGDVSYEMQMLNI
ncbi:hypothetical protein [Yersinia aleksiciae]|uniref:Uncharacterized protein n=1 Tax=Yersinia aleksiciae TaxID=263819 RepID=A0A0T9TMW3_YERAE|nr:hypothetical protein [Yersinia aleksiciae]MDA5499484.1 hypothetical protein [Yersinia aleksiciae]NIL00208.1 hypothetical protein [Yersinia aleksiciae]WQC71689.1 hypothetical protein N0K21_04275 [Yersinia aleksiciae]CFQ56783.1 Uncharacterised protein [Yersinia aleksiciae]CNK92403.1 Uncharacterised protein [Yersinia aleksiciae]